MPMHPISVVVSPELERTRLLVQGLRSELLRAVLPVLPMDEPRALPTLLEGLALCFQQRLSVVLVADEQVDSRSRATFEALVDSRPLFFEVGVATRDEGVIRPHDGPDATFRDLRGYRGLAR